MSAYGALAYAYDGATGIRSMDLIAPVLQGAVTRHAGPIRTHLDLACGTGLVGQFFKQRGYTSKGVDLSAIALAIASQFREVQTTLADLRALPMLGTFGWISCLNDSLRVLTEQSDVLSCFRALRPMMTAQSIFAFDITTPAMIEWLVPQTEFPFRGEDFEMTLRPVFANNHRIERLQFSGWVRYEGVQHAINEVHDQGVFTQADILAALAEASLHAVEIVDFERYEGHPNSGWLFVVQRT